MLEPVERALCGPGKLRVLHLLRLFKPQRQYQRFVIGKAQRLQQGSTDQFDAAAPTGPYVQLDVQVLQTCQVAPNGALTYAEMLCQRARRQLLSTLQQLSDGKESIR